MNYSKIKVGKIQLNDISQGTVKNGQLKEKIVISKVRYNDDRNYENVVINELHCFLEKKLLTSASLDIPMTDTNSSMFTLKHL